MSKPLVGRLGEVIAGEYLRSNGLRIIERNHRTRYAEIDLIAREKKILVFVEVRTKTAGRFGSPEESLNRPKVRRLVKAADFYVADKGYQGGYRIDAICVVLNRSRGIERISHYRDISFDELSR